MKQILLPQWGIWISAYARRNLVKTFAKLGNDAIYGDTDSAKIINLLSNEYIFKDYNNVIARMNKTMYVGNYDREIFKDLGKFDFEGKILRFKTLGCKRYIFDQCKYNKKENKYELDTVVKAAGIVKGTFQKYCEKHNLDKYEEFKFGLVIDPEESEKLTSHYEDKPFEVEVTDYYGNTELIKENSCVTLKPEAISITFGAQAKAYLLLMAEVAMCYERTGLINTYFR